MSELLARIRGGLYGVAVGDALGATLEFVDRAEVGRRWGELREIVGGGWLGLAPGEWTDDTEMTLAVAEGILDDPDDPLPHVGERFLRWKATNPPDIGVTIAAVLRRMERGDLGPREWHRAARAAHEELRGMSAGNGALMRTLPVGLAYGDPARVSSTAFELARMTHWDERAGRSCAIASLMAFSMLRTGLRPAEALEWASGRVAAEAPPEAVEELTGRARRREWEPLRPSGFTVDSLHCALWALLESNSFEEAVVRAVNLGGDADTIGAIAGGLAGVHWGFDAIPKRWVDAFTAAQRERLDQAAARLASLAAGS